MGKVAGFIVGALEIGIGIATGNVGLIITGVATLGAATAAALAKTPKPEITSVALKSPVPPRVSGYGRLRLYGAYSLYVTSSDGRAVDVWAFHDGRVDGIENFYIGDDKVTVNGSGWVAPGEDGRYGKAYNRVQVKANLGLPTETAWSEVISALPGIWTANHRGDGVVTGFMISTPVKAKDFSGVYSSGGPNQTPLSLVMRASCVFDWRDPAQSVTDSSTWGWSENWVLHLAHYLTNFDNKDWTTHFVPTLAYWTAAADDADVAMPLKAGGTEPRYRSCVAFKHTDERKGVIANLLACGDGWLSPRWDGALVVYSGRFYEPTVTIDANAIVSYSVQDGIEEEAAVNEIPLTYVSDQHDFNTVDTDAWRDEDDISARGKVLSQPLANQIPSHAQAARLAKREMARTNAPKRGTLVTNSRGRLAVGQRFIDLRLIEAGAVFYDGPAEVLKVVRNLSTGGSSIEWVAADPNIDAWNPATEEGNPAVVGDLVPHEPLETPVIDSATASFAASTDGGTGVRVTIVAEGLNRDDVTWFARWRVVGNPSWVENQFTDLDPGPSVTLETGFVPASASVEVEVSYGTGDGRLSDWSGPTVVGTATDTTVPDDAVSITVTNWSDTLDLATGRISRAGTYRWRFYAADGTTLIKTLTSATPSVSYSSAQATADGIKRAYIVEVAGLNSAGAGGAIRTAVITNAAPPAITSAAIAGGASTATGTCDAGTDAAGYIVFYAATAGFDPATIGGLVTSGIPSINIFGLAAGTYYGRVAAFDLWTANPALLNLSSEISFTITAGGGSTPSGGGTGGGGYAGGGGYTGAAIP